MRKTLELLALFTCTAALCVTLTGCEAVKGTASGEKPVKTVYAVSYTHLTLPTIA